MPKYAFDDSQGLISTDPARGPTTIRLWKTGKTHTILTYRAAVNVQGHRIAWIDLARKAHLGTWH